MRTPEQEHELVVAAADATEEARMKLTLYRCDNEEFALFRRTAMRHCGEMTTALALGNKIPVATLKYFEQWVADGSNGVGDHFRAFIRAVEKATGKSTGLGWPEVLEA